MTRSATTAILLLAGFASQPARAAAPETTVAGHDERPSSSSGSYAGQIVTADLAAASLALGTMGVLSAPAATLYVGTPAVIHLLHHNPGRAALSVGLRLALPVAGGLLAGYVGCSPDDECGGRRAAGVLAGAVAASIIDGVWLAHDDRSAATGHDATASVLSSADGERRAPAAGITTAGLMPLSGGAGLVVGGRF